MWKFEQRKPGNTFEHLTYRKSGRIRDFAENTFLDAGSVSPG
jgi:hypothetical protein